MKTEHPTFPTPTVCAEKYGFLGTLYKYQPNLGIVIRLCPEPNDTLDGMALYRSLQRKFRSGQITYEDLKTIYGKEKK